MDSFAQNPLIQHLAGQLDATALLPSQTPSSNQLASAAGPMSIPGMNPMLGGPQSITQPMRSPTQQPIARQDRPYLMRQMQGAQSSTPSQTPSPEGAAPPSGDPYPTPVRDFLAEHGVTAPSNLDSNLFIHDPQAFAKHPLVAGLLERGLEGAAYIHAGATPSEALNNIATGLQNIQGARNAQAQAQYQQPFQQLAQLQAAQAQQATIGHTNAQAAQASAMAGKTNAETPTVAPVANSVVAKNNAEAASTTATTTRQDAIAAPQIADANALKQRLDDAQKAVGRPLTGKEQADIINDRLTEESVAKAAGPKATAQVGADAHVKAAGIGANATLGAANIHANAERDVATMNNAEKSSLASNKLSNPKPTADQTKRGNLADNAYKNLTAAENQITEHKAAIGPVVGNFTHVQDMLGSADPVIRKLGTSIQNASIAATSAHGLRNVEAQHDFADNILKSLRSSPEGAIAAIRENQKSLADFVRKGGQQVTYNPNRTFHVTTKDGADATISGKELPTFLSNGDGTLVDEDE